MTNDDDDDDFDENNAEPRWKVATTVLLLCESRKRLLCICTCLMFVLNLYHKVGRRRRMLIPDT